jgi:hypothetical protein
MIKTFTHKLTEEEHAMLCNLLELGWEHKDDLLLETLDEEYAYEDVYNKVYGARPDARKENA